MKQLLVLSAALLLLPLASRADDRVLPAQADDIEKADANLGESAKVAQSHDLDQDKDQDKDGDKDKDRPLTGDNGKNKDKGKHKGKARGLVKDKDDRDADDSKDDKAAKDNFGSKVSAEAKKLKDSDPATRKKFGQGVAAQRRQNQNHAGSHSDSRRDSAEPTQGGQLPPPPQGGAAPRRQ